MKRFARLMVLGALLVSSTALVNADISAVQDKIAGLKQQATSRSAAKPWLQRTMSNWKSYLLKTPDTSYLPSKRDEEVRVSFSHQWAKKAFGGDGSKVDPSALAFGTDRFPVRELFAASNLLVNEEARVVKNIGESTELANNSRHYLYMLANQQVGFESNSSEQQINLSYERLFLNKKLALSVDVPFTRQEHRMAFDTNAEITRANRSALVEVTSMNNPTIRNMIGDVRALDAPPFYEQYNSLEDFVHRVLDNSGVQIKKTQEAMGIGDIQLKALYKNKLNYVDECQFGASLSLGTGKQQRNVAVWEPTTVLNNGATAIQMHANLAWHRGVYANPFVQMRMGYRLPVTTGRRVPFMLNYDGSSHAGERMMQVFSRTIPFGDVLTLTGVGFSDQAENQVRGVASTVQKVTLHQGLDLNLRVGNTIERCFNRPIFITLAYDFAVSQGQRYAGLNRDHQFATDVVERNTYQVGNTIMARAGYRLNDACFLDAGIEYRFAGRNMTNSVRCGGGLTMLF